MCGIGHRKALPSFMLERLERRKREIAVAERRSHGNEDESGGGETVRQTTGDYGMERRGAGAEPDPDENGGVRSVPHGSARGEGRLAGKAGAAVYSRA